MDERFQGISRDLAGRVRPGIMKKAQSESSEGFRASSIDSKYTNSIIGKNMRFLDEARIVRTEPKTSRGDIYYKIGPVEPAVKIAEQIFTYKIINGLTRTQENSTQVVEDLGTFALLDDIEKEKLPVYRGELKYHEMTDWLFDTLNLIDNQEDRNFIADETDIQYLVDNRDEWGELAEALNRGEEMPEKFEDVKDDYETTFLSENEEYGRRWTGEDLDRLR